MSMSLAVKYRPKTWSDVCEQNATLIILQQQLASNDVKNSYLFCGPAGCGKTTCARIFANEINKGLGSPIELDAASNNSVDDVREIIQQAKTVSLNSEYKVFIMDEVHALSSQAWQAMLKVLEEPPVKSIFIMCTTDPQKIPKTILSRVQRFDFQRISTDGIFDRLCCVVSEENVGGNTENECAIVEEALKFIAKQAQGGMRDALTMLDKCLAYSNDLTIENVIKALGVSDYATLTSFLAARIEGDRTEQLDIVNAVYMSGADLKQFIKDFTNFVVDCCKYNIVGDKYVSCPNIDEIFTVFRQVNETEGVKLLDSLIKLQVEIKWNTNPKARIEAWCITGE